MGKWVVGIPHVEAICAAHTHSVFHQFRHGELTLQLRFAEREVPEISKQAKIFAKVKEEEKMAAKGFCFFA